MNNKKSIENVITTVMDKVERVYKHEEKIIGIDSGFTDFNTLLGGIQNELLVIASHPGIGKTALGMGFVLKMAKEGLKGVVFSCDISSELLTQRLLSMETGISVGKMNHGLLKNIEVSRLKECSEQFAKYPITIEDEKNSIDDIISEVRAAAKEKKVKWIVIDSFGSISASDINATRSKQIAEISDNLKSLQIEIDIPLIVTLGLKKGSSKRMPELSDLSEFRVLENDSDTLLFLYCKNARKYSDDGFVPVEVIVAKQKNGVEGMFDMLFNPTVGVFYNKT